MRELLAGTSSCGSRTGVVPFLAPSAEGAWDQWTRNYGPTKMLAPNLAADRRDPFRSDMIAFHRRFETELGVLKPRECVLSFGVRR